MRSTTRTQPYDGEAMIRPLQGHTQITLSAEIVHLVMTPCRRAADTRAFILVRGLNFA